eukprot:14716654-Alexandrium_andersonii.AAC.1
MLTAAAAAASAAVAALHHAELVGQAGVSAGTPCRAMLLRDNGNCRTSVACGAACAVAAGFGACRRCAGFAAIATVFAPWR